MLLCDRTDRQCNTFQPVSLHHTNSQLRFALRQAGKKGKDDIILNGKPSKDRVLLMASADTWLQIYLTFSHFFYYCLLVIFKIYFSSLFLRM